MPESTTPHFVAPDSTRSEGAVVSSLLVPGLWPESEGAAILALETSRAWTSEVLGGLAPLVLEGHRRLYCVDGGNSFDPYAFSHYARRRGYDPEAALGRVFITRAFTIHQLEAAVTGMLEPLSRDPGGRHDPAIGAVLGLDHLFLEETLPTGERRAALSRVLASLGRARDGGMMLIATHDPPTGNPGRDWPGRQIARTGDLRARTDRDPGGATRLCMGRGSPFSR